MTHNVQHRARGKSLLLRVKEERGVCGSPRVGLGAAAVRREVWEGSLPGAVSPHHVPWVLLALLLNLASTVVAAVAVVVAVPHVLRGDSSTGGCGATPSPAAPAEQRLCWEEMQALEVSRVAGVQGGVSSRVGSWGRALLGRKYWENWGGEGSGSAPLSSRSTPGAGLPTCLSRGHFPACCRHRGGRASPPRGWGCASHAATLPHPA